MGEQLKTQALFWCPKQRRTVASLEQTGSCMVLRDYMTLNINQAFYRLKNY
jgi:hypothetical protein